jgi:adhesin/invasin
MGSGRTDRQSVTLTADLTLFARWSPNSNTVTFNSNYTGGPTATTQSITTDTSTALTANTFTRTGYTFFGWNTAADGSGTTYTNSQAVTLNAPLNLFAVWYRISITTQPVGKASGTTLQTQPVVRIEDGNGVTVTSHSATSVTVAIASGSGGTLGGTQTLTFTNGVATFTNLTLAGTVGTNYVLSFTSSPSYTAATSQNVTVTPGAVSAANSTVTPTTATVFADGVSTQKFTVTLKDAQGNTFTSTSDTVVFSRSNNLGTFGTTINTAPGVYEGVYTSGTSPGTDTITVSANSIALSTQPVITLNPGIPSASTSTVSAAATSLTANGSSTSVVTIRLKDSSGNNIPRGGETVTIRVSSGTGSIGSVTDNSNGTYTATYTSSTTSGAATLTASVGGTDIVDTETITLNPGTATKLGVTVQPSNSNASGATLATQPRVAIQDANGNTVTTASATITVGLVGTNGTLGGTLTANTSSGVATFSGLTLAGLTSNTYRLSFSAPTLTGLNSDLISITPGVASTATSTVIASNTSIVANGLTTSTITVQLKDAQGNNLTAAGGTVVVSKTSGGGTVGVTTNNNNGTYSATFTSPTTVGTAVIQATVGGSTITDTDTISLVAGPAAKISISRAPVTGANASTFTTQPQITLQDANNNTVITNSSSTVTATLLSGANGTLSGTDQVTFVNGVATFTNLVLTGRTSTNYVLRFTADSFTADSGNLTLTPGTASTVTSTVVATDSTLTATGSTSTTITIRLRDAQTNALTTSGGTVTVAVASGGGSLSAVTNNNNGTYTATYTSGTTVGTAVITASLGGSAISDTESITLVHGVATKIRITQQPAGSASGTTLGTQPIVEITDVNNNRVLSDSSSSVTVAISAGNSGSLTGTRTLTASSGLVQFTNLNLAGLVGQNYKLTFSSGSLTSVESASISVTPGAAVVGTSTIAASNTSIVANGSTTSTITVQLKDAQGNSLTTGGDSVGVRVSSGTGSVGSVTNVGNGTYTATFTSSTTAGTSTITASLGASDITATQNIALIPGTATKLAVTVQPSSTNASGAVIATQPRVAIQDANGNIATGVSATTITAGVIGSGGSVGGSLTATTSSGVATFSGLTLAGLTSNNYVLSFTANGLTGIDSNTISITPGAAATATSTVTASSNSIVADGSTTSLITVQLKDAQGNSLTAGGGTVVVSKQSGGGTVSVTTNNNDGTYSATFTSPTTAGTTVIRATVGGNAISDTESITLRHGVASQLVITQAPVAGASSSLLTTQPQVTLQDANGNTVTANSVDTVTVAISSGANGNLTGTKTLVLSNGVATFTDLNLAGRTGTNYVLRFESGLFSTTSANIQVAAGAPSTVTSNVSVSSNSLTANGTSTSTITVTLRDSESNQLPTGGRTVALSVTSGFGSIGTVTDNANGTYTATYTSGTVVGTATISATINTAAIAETKTITLVHGPATKVTITQQPATGASGTNLTTQPKVVLRDANNNIATSDDSSTVTVAITSGSNGSLTGTKTVTVVDGEAVFTDLSFAGIVGTDYKLRFTSGSLTVADSNNMRVTPGVAVVGTSTISASNTSIVANGSTTSNITIQLKDAQGNSLTTGENTVTIRVSSGTGSIGSITNVGNGTYTSTFTSSTTAGTSTLIASFGGNDITATQDISLIPGAATKLGILTEPPNTTSSGTVLATQPRIAIQDAFGNTVTSDTGRDVTIGLIGNNGSLGGTLIRSSASGIVTFSGVTLAGLTSETYVLSFSATGLTGINSQVISMTPGAASTATSTVTASTTSIVADGNTTSEITVTLRDAQSNLLVASGGTVLVSKASGNGTVSATTNNANGSYTAIFTSPTTVGTTVIQATIGGSTITDTETITLVHGTATQIKITQTPITGANASTFTRQPKVTLFDANDNIVTTNSSGTVGVALHSGANGTLSGTAEATFVNGVATFTNLAITGRTSTDYVLRFTSGSFTVDSGNLTLTPGTASASTSTIVVSDSTLIANGSTTTTVTVRLKDAQTNALVASGGTVAINVASGDGAMSTVTNNNDGTYTATYTSGTVVGTKAITASVNSVTLNDTTSVLLVPGPATKILITQQPAGTSSGTALGTQPQVEITDAFNNRVTGDSSTQVTAAISSGTGGTLGGTRTVTASLGVATFTDLTLAGLVSQSYKLTFSSGSLTARESSAISVTPGVAVASTSTISASSTSITANEITTSTITVQLKDAQGNSLVAGGNSVGMQITTGGGTLSSVADNSNGTYSATYTSSRVAGPIEIRARLGGVEIGEVQNLTLTPGSPTKLALHVAPTAQRSGEVLATQPKISVQDQYGNIVTTDSGRVITVAISAGNGGSLDGTLTASTSNGIASFSDVALSGITTSNYVLGFTTPN